MERKHGFLVALFAMIMLVSIIGFYKSYISFFPAEGEFSSIIHVHFVAFILWFCLFIIQPILIKREKVTLHRKLGKVSYFIAPVLVFTILWLVIGKVRREILISIDDASVTALIGILDVVSFSAFYIIAMVNRRNIRWHVAFIVAASLIVLNPGMSRLLNQISPGAGILGSVLFPFIVSITIILFEKFKFKRPILKSPYSLFFYVGQLKLFYL